MKRRILWMLPALAGAATLTTIGLADGGNGAYTSVAANIKAAGYAPASVLSPELRQTIAAQGSTPLENPQGPIGWYGYINDAPSSEDPTLHFTGPLPLAYENES